MRRSYATKVPSYRQRPRDTGPSVEVKRDVMARCLGRCERCGGGLADGHHIHHRRPRAMGGTGRPETNGHANLAVLCPGCHTTVESYRAEAYGDGWLVSQHADPAMAPVLLHGERWVYLTATGYSDNPPEREA